MHPIVHHLVTLVCLGVAVAIAVVFGMRIFRERPPRQRVKKAPDPCAAPDDRLVIQNERFHDEPLPAGVSRLAGGIAHWQTSGEVARVRSKDPVYNHLASQSFLAPYQEQFVALYGDGASISQTMHDLVVGCPYQLVMLAGSRHPAGSPLVGTLTVFVDDAVVMQPTPTPLEKDAKDQNQMSLYGILDGVFTPTKSTHTLRVVLNGNPSDLHELTSAVGAVQVGKIKR